MKTTKTILAAAMLPLLFSCVKEEVTNGSERPNKEPNFAITVSTDPELKAVFDDADGLKWVTPGKAGLVKKDNTTAALESTDVTVSENAQQATFKFSVETNDNYRLYYPYTGETYYRNIKFTVPSFQKSKPGTSEDVFAGVATTDVEVSGEFTSAEDVIFKAVGSYIRFAVYGKAGEKVSSIEITSEVDGIAGEYFVDPNKGDSEGTGEIAISSEKGVSRNSQKIVVVVDGDYTISAEDTKDNAKGIYASILPGNYQLTYKVTTDKGFYTFKSSASKDFGFGEIKVVNLNLANANCVPSNVPSELYIFGDATLAGWNQYEPIAMTYDEASKSFSANVYLEKELNGANTVGFKFLTRKGYYEGSYINSGDGSHMAYCELAEDDANNKFTAPGNGYYTVTANFTDMTVTCTPAVPEKLYFVGGTESTWELSSAKEMTKIGNTFSIEVDLIPSSDVAKNGYKFLTSNTTYDCAFVNDGEYYIKYYSKASGDYDKKFTVNDAGRYYITVDFDTKEVKNVLYPVVTHYAKDDKNLTTIMNRTSDGVYVADNVKIGGSDGYSHDFYIKLGSSYYHTGDWTALNDLSALSIKVSDIQNSNDSHGWYLSDTYDEHYYDLTLNTNDNTLTVTLSRGNDYWLIGDPFGSFDAKKRDEYKASADENGIVTWDNMNLSTTGEFKICGEHNFDDYFWKGEWYYSNDAGGFNWSWDGDNNYSTDSEEKQFPVEVFCGDQKWKLNETGTFKIVFDTKNLKIKVYKK
ncbi:MAG: hypothetical protein ACI4TM_10660 [Candidatus Cryptobacteroides sp.]